MRRRHGIRRRRVVCPECEGEFTISWRVGVRHFRAPRERCPDCGYVGRRGEFESAFKNLRGECA